MRSVLLLCVLWWVCAHVYVCAKAPLRFREDGTFKISQIADVHFGEAENTLWGPKQDRESLVVMRTVLSLEKPDLVVFSGDQITGNNIADNATAYWEEVVSVCIKLDLPWAIIFGNHDDLANGTHGDRSTLIAYDMSHDLSYTQNGPTTIHGTSNYVLPISSHDGNETWTTLYFLDSGGGTKNEEVIWADQVDWYRQQSSIINNNQTTNVIPAVAFFHIPIFQYENLYDQSKCFGTANDSVDTQTRDTGIFKAFVAQQDVKATFIGHDHGNDWCCPYGGISLCWGRHSGYGGYGTWARGSRQIQFRVTDSTQQPDDNKSWSLSTWVRMEDGTVIDGNRTSTTITHHFQPHLTFSFTWGYQGSA